MHTGFEGGPAGGQPFLLWSGRRTAFPGLVRPGSPFLNSVAASEALFIHTNIQIGSIVSHRTTEVKGFRPDGGFVFEFNLLSHEAIFGDL